VKLAPPAIVRTGMKRIACAAVVVVAVTAGGAAGGTDRKGHELLILVNTPDEVYKVDPSTLALTKLGTFSFPGGREDRITDITLDRKGRMWAIGFEAVYSVDPTTFACTTLAEHPGRALNSLAIVTGSMMSSREVPDLMLATEADSSMVYLVDPTSGALTPIGDMGGALESSGDLTWAPGVGAVQIVTDGVGKEGIAKLDPDTFAAHLIGTGWPFQKTRGLAMVAGGLLGFTEQGDVLSIDTRTGDATVVKSEGLVFYGAAVGWADTITPRTMP
jgi:hypothetical protein